MYKTRVELSGREFTESGFNLTRQGVEVNRMYADGFKFYLSDNNVWLTAAVPATYIIETKDERN